MSDNELTCDNRGVILPCSDCQTANRIAYSRVGQTGKCGSCGAKLPAIGLPVVIDTESDFDSLISDCKLPVVVDFWAPWCGPCQTMGPEFSKAAGLAEGEAVLVKVNTESLPQLSNRYQIRGIPAFYVIKNGQVAGQTSGGRQAEQLLEWLRSV